MFTWTITDLAGGQALVTAIGNPSGPPPPIGPQLNWLLCSSTLEVVTPLDGGSYGPVSGTFELLAPGTFGGNSNLVILSSPSLVDTLGIAWSGPFGNINYFGNVR